MWFKPRISCEKEKSCQTSRTGLWDCLDTSRNSTNIFSDSDLVLDPLLPWRKSRDLPQTFRIYLTSLLFAALIDILPSNSCFQVMPVLCHPPTYCLGHGHPSWNFNGPDLTITQAPEILLPINYRTSCRCRILTLSDLSAPKSRRDKLPEQTFKRLNGLYKWHPG